MNANALTIVEQPRTNAAIFRESTDAASLCREIVLKMAIKIQGRRYLPIEAWQAIAIAHGCVGSAENVRRLDEEASKGFAADGVIRRMSDGAEIARAEGFVGDDEKMWASRPVYARRAMAQTRSISRACRSAFAHVVIMIDADLSTTPAEEVPDGGFDDASTREPMRNVTPTKRNQPSDVARPARDAAAEPAPAPAGADPTPQDAGSEAASTEQREKHWAFVNDKLAAVKVADRAALADIQRSSGKALVKMEAQGSTDIANALVAAIGQRLEELDKLDATDAPLIDDEIRF